MTADPDIASPPASPPRHVELTDPSPAQVEEAGWVSARPPRMREVLGRILRFPKLLVEHRDLISTSVRRDLEARFTGTILGWFWPLIHPLFLFVVYYFIFTKLLSFKIPDPPAGQESALGVYMFCGIMVWAAVAESLTRGTNSIVENGNLIKKLAFPSEILPLNVTLVGLVTLSFAVIMFVVACFVTPIWPRPGLALAWIPVLMLVQGIFTYGLALFLSTLQVFLRDTIQIIGIVVTIWMFVTPLFWVPELMGESIAPYESVIRANPVYHLVMAWRGVLMGRVHIEERDITPVDPDLISSHLVVFSAWAVVFFVVGYGFFILSQRRFADEV